MKTKENVNRNQIVLRAELLKEDNRQKGTKYCIVSHFMVALNVDYVILIQAAISIFIDTASLFY